MPQPAIAPHDRRRYRADIDGLRAIAVMLVVLNHLQFRYFTGGYVGVDVFFIISGYLIGSSMISEFKRGSFSLAAFYERRVRRIFPALLVMLFAVTALAYRYLMPIAFTGYARSLLTALLSFSNLQFWHEAGYFDAPSAAKPLLHTWSLAVEEQFYIFLPLVLWLVFRWFPLRVRSILWCCSGVSFLLAIWVTRVDSPTAFFWSPLRAWELLGGVLVSQHAFALLRKRNVREIAAAIGLAMILIPGAVYSSATVFPGWTALPPCLGAALIIAAGQVGPSVTGSLLSTTPFTFIGLISYSLYLWHWPIFVFQNTALLLTDRPSYMLVTKLIVLGVSLVIATLSWRFVETPFRKGFFKRSHTHLFVVNGVAALIILIAGIGFLYTKGLPSRFPENVVDMERFSDYKPAKEWREPECFLDSKSSFKDYRPDTCLNASAGKKTYLIYGDSTAAQLYPGLTRAFSETHFQQATSSSCPPYQGNTNRTPYSDNCHALWRYMHETYLSTQHPDAVLLAATWSQESLELLGPEIQNFQNRGIQVILIGPPIDFNFPLPLLLAAEMQEKTSNHVRAENITRHMNVEAMQIDTKMSKMAKDQWHVQYISYFKDLCGQQIEDAAKAQWETTNGCPLFTDSGEPLIFDQHHFTLSGSLLFANTVRRLGQIREQQAPAIRGVDSR
jgi:peptidoglycan/LPS O-acetylase OafA/YrhL